MLLLPMDQIVFVGLRLLVAEGTSFQGDQRLLAPPRPHGANLALLDFPYNEAVFQEVFLHSRRRSTKRFGKLLADR